MVMVVEVYEFGCCVCVFFSLGGGVVVADVGSWCQFLAGGWWVF